MTTETKELTVLDEFKILEVYKYDVIEKAAEAIETEVMSEVVNVTTAKGREREKSLAFKVSQAKSRVVKMANGSIEDARATVKAVTAERLRLEARFDGIRDKRKAASVKWDLENQERIDGHKAAIAKIKYLESEANNMGRAEAGRWIEFVNEFDGSVLEEFAEECDIAAGSALKRLIERKIGLEEQVKKDAELKRLQDEAEKRKIEDEERAKRLAEVEAEKEEKQLAEQREKEAKAKRLKEEEAALDEIRAVTAADNNESTSDIIESLEELENFDMAYFVEKHELAETLRQRGLEMLNRMLETAREEARKENIAIEAARVEAEVAAIKLAKEQAEEQAKAAKEAEKQRQIDEDKRIEQAKKDAIKATEDRLKKVQAEKDADAKRKADAQKAKDLAARNKELERQADKDHRANVRAEVREFLKPYMSEGFMPALLADIEAGKCDRLQIKF